MSQKIKISFDKATTAPYKKLVNLQGDLKILTEVNYQKIRNSILEHGFMEPISVWIDASDEGKMKILNGHQRLAAVKRMVEKEDFSVDELPINLIKAATIKEAKLKVLALTSEYGEMTQEGLTNFMLDLQMSHDDLVAYVSQTANLKSVDMNAIFENLKAIKVDIPQNDALNIDNMVAGSPTPMPQPTPEPRDPTDGSEVPSGPRNDPDTGLRVLQVFLSEDQIHHAKELIDKVSAKYGCKNISEAVLKALEVATEEKNENDKPVTKKKSKT